MQALVKKKVFWIVGILLVMGLIGLMLMVFNLDIRDDVRTPVMHTYKQIQAFCLGAKSSVPVLEYHGVDTNYAGEKRWYVSPAEFEKQLKYLNDNGFTTITVKQLANFKSIKNPVALMFDDGYADVYTYAYPLLKKYNMKATSCLVSDMVGKQYYLTIEQIKEMSDIFDFESHTKTHPALKNSPKYELIDELGKSRWAIESLTGQPVIAIAYPASNYNHTVLAEAEKYYKYGFIGWGGRYYGFENPLAIPRIPIYWDDTVDDFASKIKD